MCLLRATPCYSLPLFFNFPQVDCPFYLFSSNLHLSVLLNSAVWRYPEWVCRGRLAIVQWGVGIKEGNSPSASGGQVVFELCCLGLPCVILGRGLNRPYSELVGMCLKSAEGFSLGRWLITPHWAGSFSYKGPLLPSIFHMPPEWAF